VAVGFLISYQNLTAKDKDFDEKDTYNTLYTLCADKTNAQFSTAKSIKGLVTK
jgi:hypothetical protein